MAATRLRSLLGQIEKLSGGPGERQGTDRQLLDDFSARRDEAAFAELVARHGPMVLRVCRRVLHHEQDAEDTFQATFLVLAQCCGSIRKREALADWLHGVAYRTAMNAKRSAARRRNHEARLRERTPPTPATPTWDDVQAILDDEIQRLPAVFRSAFVLSVLEGKTIAAVAVELGCKEGTVATRVMRARQRLQQQLARRGIKLAALLAALCVAQGAARASVSAALARSAVRNGLLVAAGGSVAGAIPSHVAALATGVTGAMFLQKAKVAVIVLLAVGLFVVVGSVLTHQALAAKEQPLGNQKAEVKGPQPSAVKDTPKEQATDAKPKATEDKDSVAYGGRVLGPDGKPVAGAKLYLTHATGGFQRLVPPPPETATTGADGRFAFTAPRATFGDRYTVVAALAPKHGAGWVELAAGGKRDDLTVRLVADDAPLTGQIVDLEGKPVPGATLRVFQIQAAPGDDLGPWLEAVKGKKGLSFELENQYLTRCTIALTPQATTDAEGRFRLTGIGRNRLVRAQLDGPTIASENLCILTRPGKTFEVTEFEGQPEYGYPRRVAVYYGSDFRHSAVPTKPIVGVVRDKDTKKPLAGVTVQSHKMANSLIHGVDFVRTTTDAQGRYRLTGMPAGEGGKVMLVPPADLPYVAIQAEVPDSPGLGPVTVNFELKRGVWIEGKITDKVTGKPLRGSVEYYAMANNPNLRDHPGFSGTHTIVAAKADGSYRVVGMPGPGLIGVYYSQRDYYLPANVRDDEYGAKQDHDKPVETDPFLIYFTGNYSAIARLDAAKGVETVKRDITLDPGWMFTGRVLGPDGKALAGVRSFGLARWGWWLSDDEELNKGEFEVCGFDPKKPRDVLFQHYEKGLVGVAQPPKDKGGSVTVQMEAGAAITGRLVNADGKPRAGVELEVSFRTKEFANWCSYLPEPIKTDAEGRFRIAALLPGYEFRLSDGQRALPFGDGLRLGKTKDLGDVQMK